MGSKLGKFFCVFLLMALVFSSLSLTLSPASAKETPSGTLDTVQTSVAIPVPTATPTPSGGGGSGGGAGSTPTAAPVITTTPTATPTQTTTPTPTTASQVKIGAICAWSGPMAVSGLIADPIIKLVEWQVKQQGGILGGREVKVVKYDDSSSVALAAAGARKLIVDDKVSALVFGGTYGAEESAVSAVAEEYKVPFLTYGDLPNLEQLKFTANTMIAGEVWGDYWLLLANMLNAKTVAIVGTDQSDVLERNTRVKEIMKAAGIEIVYEQYIDAATQDFSPYLTKIKYLAPDVVCWDATSEAYMSIGKQIVELGGWGNTKLLAMTQAATAATKTKGFDGQYVLVAWMPGLTYPGAIKYEQDYKTLIGGVTNPNHIFYYNALWTAIHAIEMAGTNADPVKIAEVVRSGNLEWDTPCGRAHFTTDGQSGLGLTATHVEGGKLVVVPIQGPPPTPKPPTILAPPKPIGWQVLPQNIRSTYGINYYFPGEWITMTNQPLPTIIMTLDPTFFPNADLRVFDVPESTTAAQFRDIIKAKYPSQNGGEYDNFQVLEEGYIILDNGVPTAYMIYKGVRMGYSTQSMAVFLVRGARGFILTGSDYPVTFTDSKEMLTQIVKTFHLISQPILTTTVSFLSIDEVVAKSATISEKYLLEAAGSQTVLEQYYSSATVDFIPYLTKIRYVNPDLLVICAPADDVQTIQNQILEVGGWGNIMVAYLDYSNTPIPPYPPVGWQELPQDLQDTFGVNYSFPGEWITISQPLPTIILALHPAIFPNTELRKFDLPIGMTPVQFREWIKNKYPSQNGGEYDNFIVLEEGDITLDNGVQTVYMIHKGSRNSYSSQSFDVFLVRGTQGFILQCCDYPVTFNDTKPLLVQIAKTFHLISQSMYTIYPNRILPDVAGRSQTFKVAINFTSPSCGFGQIGVIDNAPVGWAVTVDKSWCTPPADDALSPNSNQAAYVWFDNYCTGTQFTVAYKVTVPAEASYGSYSFSNGQVGYNIGGGEFIYSDVGGDWQIGVANGSPINGLTYEAKGVVLPNVLMTLIKGGLTLGTTISDSQGSYTITVPEVGDYTLSASKAGHRDQTRVISIADLGQEYTFNFKGKYGLIPNAPDVWYLLNCAAQWKYQSTDTELRLDMWKLLDVAAAWKYPIAIPAPTPIPITPVPTGLVKIGAITSWSGPAAMSGAYFADPVIKLIEKQVKDQGGILGGRAVEVIRYDDRGSVAEAQAGVTKLYYNEQVSAITLGGISGSEYNAIAQACEQVQVLFSSMANVDGLSNYKFTVNATVQSDVSRAVTIEFINNVLKPKTAAFFGTDDSSSRSNVAAVSDALAAAGTKIVYTDFCTLDTTDYSPYLTKIKYENPDVLYLYSGSNEFHISIARHIMELGGWGDIKVLTTIAGEIAKSQPGAQGWYLFTNWAPGLDYPGMIKFQNDYQTLYGRLPSAMQVYYYNSLWTAIHAIELAGTDTDRVAIAQAARSGILEWDTPMGLAHFTPDGQSGLIVIMAQIQNGQLVIVPSQEPSPTPMPAPTATPPEIIHTGLDINSTIAQLLGNADTKAVLVKCYDQAIVDNMVTYLAILGTKKMADVQAMSSGKMTDAQLQCAANALLAIK